MTNFQKPMPLTLEKAFGQILRALRKGRGMKQVEVSAATGYSQRTIGMIERGEKSPTLRTMEDFATFYDVPLEHLIVQAKQLRNNSMRPSNHTCSAAFVCDGL
jgi:transcriptional regulator with XRE-family HTH domain